MKQKILVIDDSDVDRLVLTKVLEKKGFDVVSLASGENCLQVIGNENPQLVLLDILMPVLHGNQILRQLREKYSTIQLPIIMITAKSDSTDIIESLSLGANDYIVKPVDFEIATMRIRTHLKISSLSCEMQRMKEIETINAMITTCNHEINNPLSIALGTIQSLIKNYPHDDRIQKIEGALWRIADIVKRMSCTASQNNATYEKYTDTVKMIKLK